MNNKVIVIGGPTASGKSKLAIDLAMAFDGEIINADSMQVYKDTPILSAIPDEKDKKCVNHHLFAIYESSVHGNVVDWLDLCVSKVKIIQQNKKIPIVVGGTGLYLQNLISGTTPIPATPTEIRNKIKKEYEDNSLEFMYEKLQKIDKVTAEKLSRCDTSRILRAIEVFEATGIMLSQWYKQPMVQKLPDADFVVIKLMPDIADLEKKCNNRFEKMIQLGALKEVETILSKNLSKTLPAMKALGVPELSEYLLNTLSLEDAIKLAQLHTRQYAKRQLTWFKKQLEANIVLHDIYDGSQNVVNDVKNFL